MQPCPCGSGAGLAACCGPVIAGAPAGTAEALMRSRYTAYVLNDIDHIERTRAAETRLTFNRLRAESTARAVEWTGLEILATSGGGEADDTGTVDFVTRFRKGGKPHVLREISRFRREQGRWVYVDGVVDPEGRPASAPKATVPKVGRNAPCPCGSGRKYKKCCGA